jgi:hypothetical protein
MDSETLPDAPQARLAEIMTPEGMTHPRPMPMQDT